MMLFCCGKFIRQAVNRSGRCRDDLFHIVRNCSFKNVESAIGQNFESQTRLLGALGDGTGGHVEDKVDPVHDFAQVLGIANVTFNDLYVAIGHGPAKIIAPASHEIIEDYDFRIAVANKLVRYVRADEPGASRDQDAFCLKFVHESAFTYLFLPTWNPTTAAALPRCSQPLGIAPGAQKLSGNASNYGVFRHILGDDRATANDSICADVDARENRGVHADIGAKADVDGLDHQARRDNGSIDGIASMRRTQDLRPRSPADIVFQFDGARVDIA